MHPLKNMPPVRHTNMPLIWQQFGGRGIAELLNDRDSVSLYAVGVVPACAW